MGEACRVCPRLCGADRAGGARGFCGAGHHAHVAYAMLHMWEEPCLSGERGSGAVFFSGCALGCVFCQNHGISRKPSGTELDDNGLAALFRRVEAAGAHNLNLVNPTHYAEAIKRAFDIYRPAIPIIWNSGGYERIETVYTLEGYVDIFLPDYKYTNAASAARYADTPDYPQAAQAALRAMLDITGPCVFSGDILVRGTLVRHLVLPGHTASAVRVMGFVRDALPGAGLSLMTQYVPTGGAAQCPEIDRRLNRREYAAVYAAFMTGAPDVAYIQSPSSADERYIPPFDETSPIALEAETA